MLTKSNRTLGEKLALWLYRVLTLLLGGLAVWAVVDIDNWGSRAIIWAALTTIILGMAVWHQVMMALEDRVWHQVMMALEDLEDRKEAAS